MAAENVILTKFFRIADRVIMNMSHETRAWSGRNLIPDGAKGTVVGFTRYKRDVSIIDYYCSKIPGIYEGNGAAIILWDNGQHTNEGGESVCFEDLSLNESRRNDTEYNKAFETIVKIADLQSTPVEIGDEIIVERVGNGKRATYQATIGRIDYLRLNEKCDDGVTPMPAYQYRATEGWSSSCNEGDILRIVKRGNYWAWLNNKTQLSFADLKEECAFYSSIGFVEDVRNPKNGMYSWTLPELLQAVKEGTVDVIHTSPGMFGAAQRVGGKRFPDMPDLAKRCREEVLKGFADRM